MLILLSVSTPLLLVLAWLWPAWRHSVILAVPWAAVPALLLALSGSTQDLLVLDGVLLGTLLGLTETTRVFLLFTALLWLGAGGFMLGYLRDDPQRPRLALFWLLTLFGNITLILALDVISFYAAFAWMTFAAYGLIVHQGSTEAWQAGRVYLVLAVLGEGLILAGLWLALRGMDLDPGLSPRLADIPEAIALCTQRDLVIALLWLGFGVKAGIPLLHVWLPLAHPVAPAPASAVLSGAMIKAGLLGWLHVLPLGWVSLPGWGTLVMGVGLTAALVAAVIGVQQRSPKTVLAYSSISQMGLISIAVGLALQSPQEQAVLLTVILLYAWHHALAKGALFLGAGAMSQVHPEGRWQWGLLVLSLLLPALALTGLMTSGWVAKLGLKAVLAQEPGWEGLATFWVWALALAAVATSLLMARYLWLLATTRHGHEPRPGLRPASRWGWGLVLGSSVLGIYSLPLWGWNLPYTWPELSAWPGLLLPVVTGVVLAVLAWRWGRIWPIPAGDILWPLLNAARVVWAWILSVFRSVTLWVDQMRSYRRWLRGIARLAGGRGWHYYHPRRPDRFWQREFGVLLALVLLVLLWTGGVFAH